MAQIFPQKVWLKHLIFKTLSENSCKDYLHATAQLQNSSEASKHRHDFAFFSLPGNEIVTTGHKWRTSGINKHTVGRSTQQMTIVNSTSTDGVNMKQTATQKHVSNNNTQSISHINQSIHAPFLWARSSAQTPSHMLANVNLCTSSAVA